MSNNKNRPAAEKSAAGKNNSKKNMKAKQKLNAQAEKRAKQIVEEKHRAKKQIQKRSEEIRKQRAKANEKEQEQLRKVEKKAQLKNSFEKIIKSVKKFFKRVKYYLSKEFLLSINYKRVFIFIVLPLTFVVILVNGISKTVLFNVPAETRNYKYNSRLESEITSEKTLFSAEQQKTFVKQTRAKGSRRFDFYINTVLSVDDDNTISSLGFGNPWENECILIATIYSENGDVLYRSLGLECGREINSAKLFTSVSYGVHDVKVAVNAYDRETNEKIGTKYAKIKLAVGVDENGK